MVVPDRGKAPTWMFCSAASYDWKHGRVSGPVDACTRLACSPRVATWWAEVGTLKGSLARTGKFFLVFNLIDCSKLLPLSYV